MYKTPVISSVNILALLFFPAKWKWLVVRTIPVTTMVCNTVSKYSEGKQGNNFFLFVLRQVVFAVSVRKILLGTKDDCISVKVITLVLGSMEIAQGNVK